jgi:hypothetical protein
MRKQRSLDFSDLDPVAPELDLPILPAMEF